MASEPKLEVIVVLTLLGIVPDVATRIGSVEIALEILLVSSERYRSSSVVRAVKEGEITAVLSMLGSVL